MISQTSRPLLAPALLLAMLGLSAPAAAEPARGCDGHAAAVAELQRANQAQGCGLTGGAWSAGPAEHAAWCAAAGHRAMRRKEEQMRAELARCEGTRRGAGRDPPGRGSGRAGGGPTDEARSEPAEGGVVGAPSPTVKDRVRRPAAKFTRIPKGGAPDPCGAGMRLGGDGQCYPLLH